MKVLADSVYELSALRLDPVKGVGVSQPRRADRFSARHPWPFRRRVGSGTQTAGAPPSVAVNEPAVCSTGEVPLQASDVNGKPVLIPDGGRQRSGSVGGQGPLSALPPATCTSGTWRLR